MARSSSHGGGTNFLTLEQPAERLTNRCQHTTIVRTYVRHVMEIVPAVDSRSSVGDMIVVGHWLLCATRTSGGPAAPTIAIPIVEMCVYLRTSGLVFTYTPLLAVTGQS
ncbi:uncharacterized protein YALI1_B29436g [Yarrowia lipolytica]|uniref:Uncharacterized protein n=1 Tax=Yarrowia lipolytica TaxID=4952 RepID=A0A1D8N8V6_YARLL|nr:hypothetical protein YALI1_B29436g [Yarrowia lipolytica]